MIVDGHEHVSGDEPRIICALHGQQPTISVCTHVLRGSPVAVFERTEVGPINVRCHVPECDHAVGQLRLMCAGCWWYFIVPPGSTRH